GCLLDPLHARVGGHALHPLGSPSNLSETPGGTRRLPSGGAGGFPDLHRQPDDAAQLLEQTVDPPPRPPGTQHARRPSPALPFTPEFNLGGGHPLPAALPPDRRYNGFAFRRSGRVLRVLRAVLLCPRAGGPRPDRGRRLRRRTGADRRGIATSRP